MTRSFTDNLDQLARYASSEYDPAVAVGVDGDHLVITSGPLQVRVPHKELAPHLKTTNYKPPALSLEVLRKSKSYNLDADDLVAFAGDPGWDYPDECDCKEGLCTCDCGHKHRCVSCNGTGRLPALPHRFIYIDEELVKGGIDAINLELVSRVAWIFRPGVVKVDAYGCFFHFYQDDREALVATARFAGVELPGRFPSAVLKLGKAS